MIFKWLKEENCNGSVRLLYRASRDGFSHVTFRKKCSSKGPTLTIINDANGRVFGGFVDGSWSPNDDNTEIKSNRAFVFQICGDRGAIHHVKAKLRRDEAAAFNRTGFGPCFGACEATAGNFPLSVAVDDKEVYLNASFFASNMTSSNVRELEVYQVNPKWLRTKSYDMPKQALGESRFTTAVNDAIVQRWQKIYDAQSKISAMESRFADEGEFIFAKQYGECSMNETGLDSICARSLISFKTKYRTPFCFIPRSIKPSFPSASNWAPVISFS